MAAFTSTSSASLRSLYRTLSRSIRRSSAASTLSTSDRTPIPLRLYIRDLLTNARPSTVSSSSLPFGGPYTTSTSFTPSILPNLYTFLHYKAIHAELLQRYNPSHGMSQEERIRLTARRVGLDVPIPFDSSSSTNESDAATGIEEKYGDKLLSTNENLFRQGAKLAAIQTYTKTRSKEDLYSGKSDGYNKGGPLAPPGTYFGAD